MVQLIECHLQNKSTHIPPSTTVKFLQNNQLLHSSSRQSGNAPKWNNEQFVTNEQEIGNEPIYAVVESRDEELGWVELKLQDLMKVQKPGLDIWRFFEPSDIA